MTAISEFVAAPLRVRIWVARRRSARGRAVPGAVHLADPGDPAHRTCIAAVALVSGSVINVEIGRLFEGGTVRTQRPHKALSAWPMAATILLPSFYLVPVVALIYAHARWRGVRVTLWKWIASACFLVCAGAISGVLIAQGNDGEPPTLSSGLPGLLITVGAIAHLPGSSNRRCSGSPRMLNTAEDDAWLRRTLADPAFYVTEAGVLAIGSLTGLLGANAPWFVLLLIPAYGFLQQSVLHRPLQERATRDPKTGLLHFNAWQRLASEEIRRLNAAGRPWAVLFADIDNFRFYNQRHGHLGGDHALELVAQIITAYVRPKDIIARFGGEEFCVLLPDTVSSAAAQVAERVRVAVGNETGDPARGGDRQRRGRRRGGQPDPDGAGGGAGTGRPGALPGQAGGPEHGPRPGRAHRGRPSGCRSRAAGRRPGAISPGLEVAPSILSTTMMQGRGCR